MSRTPTSPGKEESSVDGIEFNDDFFEVFFKKHFLNLCAYCQVRFGFDTDLAKEVVHTGFIKLWEARQNLATGVSPKAYLYKIINNTSLDILKHEKVKRQHAQFVLQTTSEGGMPGNFDNTDLKQLRADIDAAIAALPEQMRRVFELSRFEGMKYTEIASELDISVKTVETQMSRALARLREKLSGYLTIFMALVVSLFINK
jgi:RNA polymerase sigma-70 factor (ECF subfamily)